MLGLFAFGILTQRKIKDKYALIVCLLSPLIILGTDLINNPDWFVTRFGFSEKIFHGYKFGIEILILNGFVTFFGLFLISKKDVKRELVANENE